MDARKEIRKLKLSLTQECCLSCTHCFVDKSGRKTISLPDARRGLEFFLSSPGKHKKLELAGGEAFMRFRLLKAVVAAAEALARAHSKELEIWVASNGLLLTRERLEFLKAHRIVLSISVYGTAATHDAIRKLPGGGGSFAPLRRRVATVLSVLGADRVTALLCVHPGHMASFYEDFTGIADMGFKVINIECVHGIPWAPAASRAFKKGMAAILDFVRARIEAGDFLVPEYFIHILRSRGAGAAAACPMLDDLEIYPGGEYALYPYGFVDLEKYSRDVAIGGVREGLNARFRSCAPGSGACATCVRDYYRLPGMTDGAVHYSFRTRAVSALFYSLARSRRPACRKYIRKMVEIFGK